jgi:hypothetical protein
MLKNINRIHLFVLAILIIAIWIWVFIFQFYQKTGFLEDAFIYLNIAKNILDSGTAQFFLVSDNHSLLASSPLRLLILIPSMLIARIFTDLNLSIETARLTFFLSGILSSLIFIPFFRTQIKVWGYGFIFSGILSLSTETALQMEGLLLFWLLFSFFILVNNFGLVNKNSLRQIGILVGLLFLTRPEYGLIAFLVLLGVVAYQRNLSLFRSYFIPVVICGVCWIIISLFLHVWPIPTTYLTKIITAELNLFGPTFNAGFSEKFNDYFLKDFHANTSLILALCTSYLLVISWKNLLLHLSAFFIVVVALLISQGAGNYLWYYENFFIIFLAVGFFILVRYFFLKPAKQNLLPVIFSGIMLLMFIKSSIVRNPLFAWDFMTISRAFSYQHINEKHIGNGLFKFDGLSPTYIKMVEIGIVSYFGDSSLWIYDTGGLAQAGTLKGTKDSFFSIFYPNSILMSSAEEYAKLCDLFLKSSKENTCHLHDAWAIYDSEEIAKVQYYYDDLKVGLNWAVDPR